MNCGAIPATLIQSELFGHERGSFTGAERRRVGRIEAARGGTILLDEIGDLSPELQVNLLRFLQEKTIDRVGGTSPVAVDVRVVAATHVNIEQAVEQPHVRELHGKGGRDGKATDRRGKGGRGQRIQQGQDDLRLLSPPAVRGRLSRRS